MMRGGEFLRAYSHTCDEILSRGNLGLVAIGYTVPKAFSMHETFPKLLGNISKTTLKY
jgi:hypothetical protein